MALPMVCVSLEGNTVEEVLRQAELATAEGADIIEVRFDKMYVEPVEVTAKNSDGIDETSIELVPRSIDAVNITESIEQLKKGIEKPVLFTCRNRNEGGLFPDDETLRISILEQAIASGVSWIDLELSINPDSRDKLLSSARESGATVVASVHNIESTANTEEMIELVESSNDLGDITKLCYQTHNHDDALSIFEAAWKLRSGENRCSLMGLGIGGDWTRMHAPILNQAVVFTTLKKGFSLADKGLINIQDLRIAWKMLGHTD
ncbi:MAG: hypothetical protein CMA77_01540 [Euryarchaeota archaeon]|nr:hypothetical protein [Euryarchaeota archaeon]